LGNDALDACAGLAKRGFSDGLKDRFMRSNRPAISTRCCRNPALPSSDCAAPTPNSAGLQDLLFGEIDVLERIKERSSRVFVVAIRNLSMPTKLKSKGEESR
jgi:hypothetical protein